MTITALPVTRREVLAEFPGETPLARVVSDTVGLPRDASVRVGGLGVLVETERPMPCLATGCIETAVVALHARGVRGAAGVKWNQAKLAEASALGTGNLLACAIHIVQVLIDALDGVSTDSEVWQRVLQVNLSVELLDDARRAASQDGSSVTP